MARKRFSLWLILIVVGVAYGPAGTTSDTSGPRIDTRDITVGGEIGRRIGRTIHNNLLVIDVDNDFLKPFQEKNRSSGYIGLGKLVDSVVRLSAHTHNTQLRRLKQHLIEQTVKTQEQDGYIGIIAPEKRMWALWDIHEMAYLANGLLSDYRLFHDQSSLQAAEKLIQYIMRNWQENPTGLDSIEITVFMAVTGLEETLLALYETTGDRRYLEFCVDFRKLPEWNYPIDVGRWGKVGGHAYAFFHRCLAQLRLFQLLPDAKLLAQTNRILDFLANQNGLLINGVSSQHECWYNTQDGTEGLGETCSTAYWIRLLDELIQMEQNSIYGDLMERSIYNGLFAAQSPDGRRIRYYVPFEGERNYFDGDTYCCPCNYRRIIADLPGMIVYPINGGVAVNLYTPSTAVVPLPDGVKVRLQQETEYPSNGQVDLTITPEHPTRFPLRLRIPRWCDYASVTVNGQTITMEVPGGAFFQIQREWKTNDRVTVNFPMTFRLIKGRQSQAGRVAVMRGPQLYCLNPARNPGLDGVDLRQIVIDPDTLEGPFPDSTIRPNGTACRIKGWKALGFTTGGNHNLDLFLTEFPDPDGQFTYFRVRKLDQVGIEDELINIDCKAGNEG